MKRAIKLIKRFEGFSKDAYQDGGGVWTIGYGTTKNVKPGDTVDERAANLLLEEDVRVAASAVDRHVNVILQPYERDALISFVYNVGELQFRYSTLLMLLNQAKNQKDRIRAVSTLSWWIYDNGRIVKGLFRRRQAEQMLFLFGVLK